MKVERTSSATEKSHPAADARKLILPRVRHARLDYDARRRVEGSLHGRRDSWRDGMDEWSI